MKVKELPWVGSSKKAGGRDFPGMTLVIGRYRQVHISVDQIYVQKEQL